MGQLNIESIFISRSLNLDIETNKLDTSLSASSTTSDNKSWNTNSEERNIGNEDKNKECSPQRRKNDFHNSTLKPVDVSPIRKDGDFTSIRKIISPPSIAKALKLSPEELAAEMKRLVEQINDQKAIVLECLENDCDKEELNNHMAVSAVVLCLDSTPE